MKRLWWLGWLVAWGLNAQVRIERSWVDSPRMMLGMPNVWHVRLRIPPQSHLEILPSDSLQGLEWWGRPQVDTDSTALPLTLHVRIPFSGFDSGIHQLAAQWILQHQGTTTSLPVPPPKVHIYWPNIDTSKGLRPIHPVMSLPANTATPLLPSRNRWIWSILIGILLLAGIGWWLYQRRHKISLPLEQQLSPYEYARHRLQILQRQKKWQKGNVWAYYTELSHIVRKFLEDEYQLPILEIPSSEISTSLHQKNIDGDYKTLLQFLQRTDMVKFARHQPTEQQHTETFQWAEHIVETFRKKTEDQSSVDVDTPEKHIPKS